MSDLEILLCLPDDDTASWIDELVRALPAARVRPWRPGDRAAADYALVWRPPGEALAGRRRLKAVFNLGAGVDAVLALLAAQPDLLPPHVPLIKLDDAGMAPQMVQYVLAAVLRHLRRFPEYAALQRARRWQPLPGRDAGAHAVGVMGLGALGTPVATALAQLGFAVRGWSRSPRAVGQVACFAGQGALPDFLDGLDVLVNLLPLTAQTTGILDRTLFARLAPGAQLINIGRGGHLVEEDLLRALDSGQLAQATLDVFREEPLPPDHPFWEHPRIEITPHVAALTLRRESARQIAARIARIERGLPVDGVIDRTSGY
jgi:glyoxylate/hydroxypyruvate reductase A